MHAPQKVQPVRSGPSPPKYGSGTVVPALPKNTPTGVRWKVASTPNWRPTSFSSCCPSLSRGTSCTPSMRSAVA